LGRIADPVRDFLKGLGGGQVEGQPHDTYIEMAMRFGHSRTDKPYRGKGLPQMNELITSVGGGRMSVYSGSGWWSNSMSTGRASGLLEHDVGGTLIEWRMHLDPGSQ